MVGEPVELSEPSGHFDRLSDRIRMVTKLAVTELVEVTCMRNAIVWQAHAIEAPKTQSSIIT